MRAAAPRRQRQAVEIGGAETSWRHPYVANCLSKVSLGRCGCHGFRLPDGASASSASRTLRISLRSAAPTLGNERSRPFSASMITEATTRRVNHLWSAGTTYQGACGVLVARIISSYAA